MTTATTLSVEPAAADRLREFMPVGLHDSMTFVLDALERLGLNLYNLLDDVFVLGEELLALGIESAGDNLELVLSKLNDSDVLERLGQLSPIARDGIEMGSKVALHTVRTLEPADVAKLMAIVGIVMLRPDLFALHRVAYLEMAFDLAQKLWTMS